MGPVLKFQSVGNSKMTMFDLYFSKRWSFLFPDTCLTHRRLSEPYFSNRSQDSLQWVSRGLFSPLRNQCIRVLRDATQLRYNFHNSHSIPVVPFSSLRKLVFLWLFVWLFINLMLREQTLFSSFATRFCSVEFTLGKMPFSQSDRVQVTFKNIFARKGTEVTFAWDTTFPRRTSTSWHGWLRRCGGIVVWFSQTIVNLMPETAWVSCRTLAFFFPPVTNTFPPSTPLNPLRFFTTALVSTLPCLASKFRNRSVWCWLLFTFVFIFLDNWAPKSSDESMSYNSTTVLSCADSRTLSLYRLSKISLDGMFWHWQPNFIPCCIEFLNIRLWHAVLRWSCVLCEWTNEERKTQRRLSASSGHLLRTYSLSSLKGTAQMYWRQMVAYYKDSEWSLITSLMRARRRAFFQEDPSIVFFEVWLFVAPFDKIEVEPGFVMATLVSRADTKSFMENGECAVLTNFPLPIRIRRFEEATDVRPLTWNCSKSPQWCGDGKHRQSAVRKSLFNDTLLPLSRCHAAPLNSPAIKSTFSSSITARIVRISFFPMPRFLA